MNFSAEVECVSSNNGLEFGTRILVSLKEFCLRGIGAVVRILLITQEVVD